jgi:hypothetical protein
MTGLWLVVGITVGAGALIALVEWFVLRDDDKE